jgi:hypothetical protein
MPSSGAQIMDPAAGVTRNSKVRPHARGVTSRNSIVGGLQRSDEILYKLLWTTDSTRYPLKPRDEHSPMVCIPSLSEAIKYHISFILAPLNLAQYEDVLGQLPIVESLLVMCRRG